MDSAKKKRLSMKSSQKGENPFISKLIDAIKEGNDFSKKILNSKNKLKKYKTDNTPTSSHRKSEYSQTKLKQEFHSNNNRIDSKTKLVFNALGKLIAGEDPQEQDYTKSLKRNPSSKVHFNEPNITDQRELP